MRILGELGAISYSEMLEKYIVYSIIKEASEGCAHHNLVRHQKSAALSFTLIR